MVAFDRTAWRRRMIRSTCPACGPNSAACGGFSFLHSQPVTLARGVAHANDSLTLSIAGCFRFFTLIQSGDRPARYGRQRPFLATPLLPKTRRATPTAPANLSPPAPSGRPAGSGSAPATTNAAGLGENDRTIGRGDELIYSCHRHSGHRKRWHHGRKCEGGKTDQH